MGSIAGEIGGFTTFVLFRDFFAAGFSFALAKLSVLPSPPVSPVVSAKTWRACELCRALSTLPFVFVLPVASSVEP